MNRRSILAALPVVLLTGCISGEPAVAKDGSPQAPLEAKAEPIRPAYSEQWVKFDPSTAYDGELVYINDELPEFEFQIKDANTAGGDSLTVRYAGDTRTKEVLKEGAAIGDFVVWADKAGNLGDSPHSEEWHGWSEGAVKLSVQHLHQFAAKAIAQYYPRVKYEPVSGFAIGQSKTYPDLKIITAKGGFRLVDYPSVTLQTETTAVPLDVHYSRMRVICNQTLMFGSLPPGVRLPTNLKLLGSADEYTPSYWSKQEPPTSR